MRPVDKGNSPGDFATHSHYRHHLKERIGAYCSYCEMFVSNALAVEHVIPKKRVPQLKVSWTNLLLSCTNCNSHKNIHQEYHAMAYFWPDQVNTAYVFGIDLDNNMIKVQCNDPADVRCANETIQMLGLNRNVDPPENILNRLSTIEAAENYIGPWMQCYLTLNAQQQYILLHNLIGHAKQCGFLTVWLTVFADYPEICQALIAAFPGTRVACYDPANGYRPVQQLNLIP